MYVNTVSGNENKSVLFKFFCLNIMAYMRCSRRSTSKVELAVCRNKHACPAPKNPNTPKLLEEGVCVLFGLGMWLSQGLPFCPTSESGCKHLLLLLVQLPSPCLLLGNSRKVKNHFVLPVLCNALLLLTSGRLSGHTCTLLT